jgi:small conductance mechanosensitive channel
MLIMFRPFKIGDFVEAGGTSGIIENISIFSTIMKTGDNREVIVPNGQIYADTITNYSAKDTRRIDLVFGIGYGDDLLKAKQLLTDIITNHPKVHAEPEAVIRVSELADSSVNFDVRPWVDAGNYWPVRSELIEQVKLSFDENGISIPFPQMDVHVNKLES